MRITPKEAELFLYQLANLHDAGVGRFKARFAGMLPPGPAGGAVVRAWIDPSGTTRTESIRELTSEELQRDFFLSLRDRLQTVWREPDLRRKRYGIFLTWYWALFPLDIHPSVMADRFVLPSLSPLEIALDYLLSNSDRARFCLNPDCVAPYFFAKRRSQKYCSDECAQPAKREAKLRWWEKHGKKWRAARREEARKQSAAKKNPRTKKGR